MLDNQLKNINNGGPYGAVAEHCGEAEGVGRDAEGTGQEKAATPGEPVAISGGLKIIDCCASAEVHKSIFSSFMRFRCLIKEENV